MEIVELPGVQVLISAQGSRGPVSAGVLFGVDFDETVGVAPYSRLALIRRASSARARTRRPTSEDDACRDDPPSSRRRRGQRPRLAAALSAMPLRTITMEAHGAGACAKTCGTCPTPADGVGGGVRGRRSVLDNDSDRDCEHVAANARVDATPTTLTRRASLRRLRQCGTCPARSPGAAYGREEGGAAPAPRRHPSQQSVATAAPTGACCDSTSWFYSGDDWKTAPTSARS